MVHPYFPFANGTEVMHSGIIQNEGVRTAIAHFERPTDAGFHSVRRDLPSYTWESWEERYSAAEINSLERFLHDSAHLIFKYEAEGGLGVA